MAKLMMLRQRYLGEEVEASPGYRVMPGVEDAARAAQRRGPPGRADHRQHRARRPHQARPRRPQPLLRLRRLRLRRRRAGRRLPQGARPRRASLAGGRLDRDGLDRHRRHAARRRGRPRRRDPGPRRRHRRVLGRAVASGRRRLGGRGPEADRCAAVLTWRYPRPPRGRALGRRRNARRLDRLVRLLLEPARDRGRGRRRSRRAPRPTSCGP